MSSDIEVECLNQNNKKTPLKPRERRRAAWMTTPVCIVLCIFLFLSATVMLIFIICKLTHGNATVNTNTGIVQQRGRHTGFSDIICFTCSHSSDVKTNDVHVYIKNNFNGSRTLCCLTEVQEIISVTSVIINEYHRYNGSGNTEHHRGSQKSVNQDINITEKNGTKDGAGEDPQPQMPRKAFLKSAQSVVVPKTESKVNADHVFMNGSSVSKMSSSKANVILPWVCSSYHCRNDVNSGITFNETIRGFHINKEGLFYIYCSVTFQSSVPSRKDTKHYHIISKRNTLRRNTGEQPLMINKNEEHEESRGYYNSFLSGTMSLHKGDELFVKVSNISSIYNYHFLNYFGLYEI